jgi:hypothetical protein
MNEPNPYEPPGTGLGPPLGQSRARRSRSKVLLAVQAVAALLSAFVGLEGHLDPIKLHFPLGLLDVLVRPLVVSLFAFPFLVVICCVTGKEGAGHSICAVFVSFWLSLFQFYALAQLVS